MFHMCAGQAVFGNDGPVIAQGIHIALCHVHHRFDGEYQTGYQFEIVFPRVSTDEIRHLRAFVHVSPDAVADVIFHHRESILLDVPLHPTGHFTPVFASRQFIDGNL